MWWMILLLVLAGCNAEVSDILDEDNILDIENITESNIAVNDTSNSTNMTDINSTRVNNITYPVNSSGEINVSSNETKEVLTGSFVRFYFNTVDGLKNIALSEGSKKNISGKMVEVVLVSSSDGVGKTLLRVDGQLSDPLEEKESDIVGGSYIFVMEILYR